MLAIGGLCPIICIKTYLIDEVMDNLCTTEIYTDTLFSSHVATTRGSSLGFTKHVYDGF